MTVADIHKGAVMDAGTHHIGFINSLAIMLQCIMCPETTYANEHPWVVETKRSGDINICQHKHIIQNASGMSSSAGHAILLLDSNVFLTELQQYNNAQWHVRSFGIRQDIAVVNDIASVQSHFPAYAITVNPFISVMMCKLENVLVDKENWGDYFGPYAGKAYLVAGEALNKNGEKEMGEMRGSGSAEDWLAFYLLVPDRLLEI